MLAEFGTNLQDGRFARLRQAPRKRMNTSSYQAGPAQFHGSPRRRYYTGPDLTRALTIADLRARTHRLMPRLVLEYLEGGAEDEATLARERAAFSDWRFEPRALVDISKRSLTCDVLGKPAPLPLILAPTGLNGIFRRGGDLALARAAARAAIPFVQSTMSNERLEDIARVHGLQHWFQLYVFGGDEIWQDLLARAAACGCEALVLTTNAQLYGNREWEARTRASRTRPSLSTVVDSALHARWLLSTLARGIPTFRTIQDYTPKHSKGFFESAFWVRDQMRLTLSWDTVAAIRARWRGPFLLKGLLNLDDVRLAMESGVDGVVLGGHGGRQMDWAISPLDILCRARDVCADRLALFASGGVRRGTDMLKAMALGADAVFAGRAPLYGLCAAGEDGVLRAIRILEAEALNALGQAGAKRVSDLRQGILVRRPDI